MLKKFLKNITVALIILSIVILPHVTAFAQTQTGYQLGGSYNSQASYTQGEGLGGYLSSLTKVIAELPQCKGVALQSLKNLFTPNQLEKMQDQVAANKQKWGEAAGGALFAGLYGVGTAKDTSTGEALSAAESIEVYDKQMVQLEKENKELNAKIEKRIQSMEENEKCLKSIGKAVTKLLLQKITVSTVKWIQDGFKGNPSFVDDTKEFFTNLDKYQIIKISAELTGDDEDYPWVEKWFGAVARQWNSKFAYNARYSLTEMIQETTPQYSATDFRKDFSKGGWNAFLNMAMVPANNPLGFQLLVSEELLRRQVQEQEEYKDLLAQADGFLGDQRCVEPWKPLWTREDDRRAMEEKRKADICKKWEYVTPGKLIAQSATEALNYPKDSLLEVDDLNSAVAAILDALLSKGMSELMEKGFSGLGHEGIDGSFVMNEASYGLNSIPSQSETDFYNPDRSVFLRNNPNFNVRFDLTQSFIDTQRTYIEKLKQYNAELDSLIKAIYQLDYCIPGASPDWKERASDRLWGLSKQIPNEPDGPSISLIKGIIFMLKGLSVHIEPFGVGMDLNIGDITEGILTMLGHGMPEEVMTRTYYTLKLSQLAKIKVAPSNQIGSKSDVVNILTGIIDAYETAHNRTFKGEIMPPVTKRAAVEYSKIKGYEVIRERNNEEIMLREGTIVKMYNLKALIDQINQDLEDDLSALNPLSANYDTLYQAIMEGYEAQFSENGEVMQKFLRLADGLVDEDGIADVYDLYKETAFHRDYVWEDLLGATFDNVPGSCEQYLEGKGLLVRNSPAAPGCAVDSNGDGEPDFPDFTAPDDNHFNRRLPPEDVFAPFKCHTYGLKPELLMCPAPLIPAENSYCMEPPSDPLSCVDPEMVVVEGVCVLPEDIEVEAVTGKFLPPSYAEPAIPISEVQAVEAAAEVFEMGGPEDPYQGEGWWVGYAPYLEINPIGQPAEGYGAWTITLSNDEPGVAPVTYSGCGNWYGTGTTNNNFPTSVTGNGELYAEGFGLTSDTFGTCDPTSGGNPTGGTGGNPGVLQGVWYAGGLQEGAEGTQSSGFGNWTIELYGGGHTSGCGGWWGELTEHISDEQVDGIGNFMGSGVGVTNCDNEETTVVIGDENLDGILRRGYFVVETFFGSMIPDDFKYPRPKAQDYIDYPEATKKQFISLPEGLINISTPCAPLTFGGMIEKDLKKAENREINNCSKKDNRIPKDCGNDDCDKESKKECQDRVKEEYRLKREDMANADDELEHMCDFTEFPWDSILQFERVFKIF